MFVAVVQGKVSGFCLVVSRPTELIIDLIAVDRESQNRGIAKNLIQYAWEHRQPGEEKVRVGTQLLNQPSTTLYDRVGLKRVNAYFLLHYHFEREEA